MGCVVVNVENGPGPRSRIDLAYVVAIRRLEHCGVHVAGYLDLAYGDRPSGAVHADADHWRTAYGVRSFFLDRFPSTLDPRVQGWIHWLRRTGARLLAANPGVTPDADAVSGVDDCVVFEGSWETYICADLMDVDREGDSLEQSQHLVHLVYGAPRSAHAFAHELAAARGADLYVTEASGANPWDRLSASLWSPWAEDVDADVLLLPSSSVLDLDALSASTLQHQGSELS
jgi:hypothetical protein